MDIASGASFSIYVTLLEAGTSRADIHSSGVCLATSGPSFFFFFFFFSLVTYLSLVHTIPYPWYLISAHLYYTILSFSFIRCYIYFYPIARTYPPCIRASAKWEWNIYIRLSGRGKRSTYLFSSPCHCLLLLLPTVLERLHYSPHFPLVPGDVSESVPYSNNNKCGEIDKRRMRTARNKTNQDLIPSIYCTRCDMIWYDNTL